MSPRLWPENPVFKSEAERKVFDVLNATLGDRAVILSNLKITDPQSGDIEIDFVVLIDGQGAIAIEVKGGNVTYNGQKWIQSDKTGSRDIDPHTQVVKNLYSFRNFLRNNWKYGNLKGEWFIVTPDSTLGSLYIPSVPRERIIDRAELDQLPTRLSQLLLATQNHHAPRQSDWTTRALEVFKGLSQYDTDRDAFLNNNYIYVKQVTHERREILNLIQDNPRIYVKGPAGSGKTWLAFEQAMRWSQEGLRVGILVYNRGLASYMQRKCDEIEEGLKPAYLSTFHQFANKLGSTEGDMTGFIENWVGHEEKIMTGVAKMPESEKFDAWVVDEAQDFQNEWWALLETTLKEPKTGRMAIFGDPDQSVYGKRGLPEGFFASITLAENLRNSQQIATASQSYTNSEVIARGPFGYEVEYIEVDSEEDVMAAADDAVARLADEELWNLGEIALLTTKHRHPIQVEKDGNRDEYWSELWTESDVFYGTVMGFKGLERSVVVMAVNGFHEGVNIRDVMYVGMTRARDRLVVVRAR
jgi:hypothetical protein